MKFGFIVHPRSVKELRLILPPYGFPFYPFCSDENLKLKCYDRQRIKEFFTFKEIVSKGSRNCCGKIYCIYLSPEQFIENQSLALALMLEACNNLKNWGAEVIGLGGLTGVVGSRGKELKGKISLPVTTGNSFTIYSSIKVLEKIVNILDIDLKKEKITIIGFPGSISLTIAYMLLKKGVDLILVSKRETSFLKQFLSQAKDISDANITLTTSIDEGIKRSKIILSATSTGDIIDPYKLNQGSIVIDIAQPRDVIVKKRKRKDVLIVDGGIVTLPNNGKVHCNLFGWNANDVPGCLGETIILALEDMRESYSIGRKLSIEKIEEMGRLGEKHGFITDNLRYFKKPIPESYIKNFASFYKKSNN